MTAKILIVGPAWIGDMVMAQSLFRLLKQRDPHVTIDVLAPAWTFSILRCMPEINSAIPMPLKHGELGLRARYRLGKELRAKKYDQAIVLPNSFKSALIPWFARIPRRTGWLGEFRHIVLNDSRRLDKQRYPLMIEQFMALGLGPNITSGSDPATSGSDPKLPKPYPYPQFKVDKAAQDAAIAKLKPVWRGKPVLGLSPGAAYGPAKRWPEDYFAQVAKQMLDQGWDVWLFGAESDQPLINRIMELTDNRCDSLAGRTELDETIALLSLVSGVVTNDSGLMHMAAALNKPVVSLYGSTSPDFTPPLSQNATILKLDLECQPCFKRDCPLGHFRCMRDLTPDRVLQITQTWKAST